MPMNYEPRLYIIMRKDLPLMNPGKAIAQGAHAQAVFSKRMFETMNSDDHWHNRRRELMVAWQKQADEFGTTIVLHEPIATMEAIKQNVSFASMIVDPTYPMVNHYGDFFTQAQITCMWAFPFVEHEFEYMKQFPLHP